MFAICVVIYLNKFFYTKINLCKKMSAYFIYCQFDKHAYNSSKTLFQHLRYIHI